MLYSRGMEDIATQPLAHWNRPVLRFKKERLACTATPKPRTDLYIKRKDEKEYLGFLILRTPYGLNQSNRIQEGEGDIT